MSLTDRIQSHFRASADTALAAAQALVACLAGGGKVLVCGCGGSAANAQHFVVSMVGRYEHERPGLAALALGGNAALLSGLANGQGFDHAYARELKACGQPGDMLLAISALGRSPAPISPR